jgi:quercetin dioxygenase-like cupin family protein
MCDSGDGVLTPSNKVPVPLFDKGGDKMIEKKYDYSSVDQKLIERIVNDDNVEINHMALTKDTGLPVHYSNSNVYMIIVRGRMTISLNDAAPNEYQKGNILNIPFKTKMNVTNTYDEVLEFFVVKAPNPRDMKDK